MGTKLSLESNSESHFHSQLEDDVTRPDPFSHRIRHFWAFAHYHHEHFVALLVLKLRCTARFFMSCLLNKKMNGILSVQFSSDSAMIM